MQPNKIQTQMNQITQLQLKSTFIFVQVNKILQTGLFARIFYKLQISKQSHLPHGTECYIQIQCCVKELQLLNKYSNI